MNGSFYYPYYIKLKIRLIIKKKKLIKPIIIYFWFPLSSVIVLAATGTLSTLLCIKRLRSHVFVSGKN